MDIRPEIQETCRRIQSNGEHFTNLEIDVSKYQDSNRLNQAETNALITALRANTHVKSMRFLACLSGPENTAFVNFVAETLIPSHPSLEKLCLAFNALTDGLAGKIAGALKENTQLKELILNYNNMNDSGALVIAEGIRRNNGLTRFSVPHNRIGLNGSRAIVSSVLMKPNFSLFKGLCLSGNAIGVEGGKVIAEFIPKAKSLKSLKLRYTSLGDEGCQIVASALPKTQSLKKLSLYFNGISKIGCLSVADALRNNSSLCDLNLEMNQITDHGVAALQATLQHINGSVETLDIRFNLGVSDEKREAIQLLCDHNRRIKRAFENVNNNIASITLGLWPRALELVEAKPDLLFALIKSQPIITSEVLSST